jgi:prepilin peptidase CpaA
MNAVLFPIGPCVVTLVAVAMAYDLHARRVPNWLTATGVVVALPVQIALHGVSSGSLLWFGGLLTGGLMFLPPYLMRVMGAGDVKLMAAVGAFCGAVGAFETALAAAAVGGVFSLGAMLRKRRVREGVTNAMSMLITMAATPGELRTAEPTRRIAASSIGALPYGVAIAIGAVIVLFANV